IEAGAKVVAYDPVAMEETKRIFGDNPAISYADGNYEALKNADALLLVTEWNQFRNPDFVAIKARLKTPIIFDGRNQYDPNELEKLGFEYYSIGR
ncbi:UDP-glucose 6-dehydrogenase, partial [bacterium]|nr:UDP-glucose 6-dehydrogenase [bacterium]